MPRLFGSIDVVSQMGTDTSALWGQALMQASYSLYHGTVPVLLRFF